MMRSRLLSVCAFFILFGGPQAFAQNVGKRAVPKALDKPAAKRQAVQKERGPEDSQRSFFSKAH